MWVPSPLIYSVTVTNYPPIAHIYSTCPHSKFFYQLFNILKSLLFKHTHTYFDSTSPMISCPVSPLSFKATLLERGIYALWSPFPYPLLYVPLHSSQGRHGSLMPHSRLSFSHFPNIIISNNITLICKHNYITIVHR